MVGTMMLSAASSLCATGAARRARRATARSSRVARQRTTSSISSSLDGRVDGHDRVDGAVARERRLGGLGEPVDADDHLLAGLDARDAQGLARDETALQFVDRREGAAQGQHVVEFVLRARS